MICPMVAGSCPSYIMCMNTLDVPHHQRPELPDVLVLGAGVTGLMAAIGLGQAGFAVHLIGQISPVAPGRTVALFDGSIRMLRNLGLWDALAPHAAALSTMRIVDDTGSLFTIPPVDFEAREIGLEQFGFNISLASLTGVLLDAARKTPAIWLTDGLARQIRFTPGHAELVLADGSIHTARLLAAADGRDSPARAAAGIATRQWTYPQVALTAVLAHRQPHHNISTEFQTRAGPCTLVPMPQQADGRNRSSLVWLMTPEQAETRAALDDRAFALAVQRQCRFALGAMEVEGSRGHMPMSGLAALHCTGPHLALLGEAAHVFPPIGAQGLNLGLRDVGDLVDCLTATAHSGTAGIQPALDRFEALRRGDIATRTLVVDAMNRSLLTPFLPVDFLRGAGLAALAHIGPLRRAVMRAGVHPQRLSSLMQARSA